MNKKQIFIMSVLTVLLTFMDMSGIPAGLLFKIKIADVNSGFISLMINFVFIAIIAFVVFKFWGDGWKLGYASTGLISGLKRYAFPGVLAGIATIIVILVGLPAFDDEPSIWKVLIEGILYYVGLGFVEEFYIRGLLLNIIKKFTEKRQNNTEIAIWVSSIVFGLGHIFGSMEKGTPVILFKVITTIGLGLYFGAIYIKTENLYVPTIMHIFINICALPYCFTTFEGYTTVILIGLIIIYVLLGIYSIAIMKKNDQ